MSTEQKPANEPKQEPNALASGLSSTWTKFKSGELISYKWMAIILLLVAAIGATWWIVSERSKTKSAAWVEFEGLSRVDDLKKYAESHPNTIQAKYANLEIARTHLGHEGIDKMFVQAALPGDPESEKQARETREAAVSNVEKAREEFAKLVDEFKDDPVVRVECMLGCAKAEAVLIGIPKAGQLEQRRGDPAKAIEWLEKVAEAAPDTPWGKDSKKLADTLRNQNTQEQVATLQANMFTLSPGLPPMQPGLPPGFPIMPPGHP